MKTFAIQAHKYRWYNKTEYIARVLCVCVVLLSFVLYLRLRGSFSRRVVLHSPSLMYKTLKRKMNPWKTIHTRKKYFSPNNIIQFRNKYLFLMKMSKNYLKKTTGKGCCRYLQQQQCTYLSVLVELLRLPKTKWQNIFVVYMAATLYLPYPFDCYFFSVSCRFNQGCLA